MKIEKGYALPKIGTKVSRIKTLVAMDVGDSIFDEGEKTTSSKWYECAKKLNIRKKGFLFTGRTVDGGVRVWRVK